MNLLCEHILLLLCTLMSFWNGLLTKLNEDIERILFLQLMVFDVSSPIDFERDERSTFKLARVANRVVCFEVLLLSYHIFLVIF